MNVFVPIITKQQCCSEKCFKSGILHTFCESGRKAFPSSLKPPLSLLYLNNPFSSFLNIKTRLAATAAGFVVSLLHTLYEE
jgi:hypothetical protein